MNSTESAGGFYPNYFSMHEWELFSEGLPYEYRQCEDEGKDISEYKKLFSDVSELRRSSHKEKLADALFGITLTCRQRADYAYNEPSDLEGIKALRQSGGFVFVSPGEPDENKIRGAWVGRICGCLLGKPLEGIRFTELTKLLELTGNYPMKRYVAAKDLTDRVCNHIGFPLIGKAYPDTITYAPADDDTNYTVLNCLLTEKYGKNFSAQNVGAAWLRSQSKHAYCTAERAAFINLTNGLSPPDSALYKNPYREWIGAQIRGDWFGYINPGDPEAAAEMAFRDASVSHVKNGIYGEMYVAAMIAAAARLSDIKDAVLCGLSQIPRTSRLFEAVSNVVRQFSEGASSERWFSDFHKRYNDRDNYDWCHTIPNAEIVTAALLWGGGDYGKTVCLAVQNGFDTDCNGATAGSAVGMLRGFGEIEPEWYLPLNGMLETSIYGVESVSIDKLVSSAMAQIKK